jgi:hypothetical protein
MATNRDLGASAGIIAQYRHIYFFLLVLHTHFLSPLVFTPRDLSGRWQPELDFFLCGAHSGGYAFEA